MSNKPFLHRVRKTADTYKQKVDVVSGNVFYRDLCVYYYNFVVLISWLQKQIKLHNMAYLGIFSFADWSSGLSRLRLLIIRVKLGVNVSRCIEIVGI